MALMQHARQERELVIRRSSLQFRTSRKSSGVFFGCWANGAKTVVFEFFFGDLTSAVPKYNL